MRVLPPSVKEVFFEMMWGHMPILEFEKWAKSSYDLVTSISPEDHHIFMSLDYNSNKTPPILFPLINRLMDAGEFETYKMLKLLNEAKLNNENLPKLLNEFYSLYSVDYDFLKELAVDLRDRMIKDPTASLQPELGNVTQKIIDWLTGGKIVLTGVYDEYLCSYSYNDLRTENDKNPVLRDPL